MNKRWQSWVFKKKREREERQRGECGCGTFWQGIYLYLLTTFFSCSTVFWSESLTRRHSHLATAASLFVSILKQSFSKSNYLVWSPTHSVALTRLELHDPLASVSWVAGIAVPWHILLGLLRPFSDGPNLCVYFAMPYVSHNLDANIETLLPCVGYFCLHIFSSSSDSGLESGYIGLFDCLLWWQSGMW